MTELEQRAAFDILNSALNRLADANTPAEVLEAISSYPRSAGAISGVLFSVDSPGEQLPEWADVIASWSVQRKYHIEVGTRLQTLTEHLGQFSLTFPVRPILIGDTHSDQHVDQVSRSILSRSGVQALVQLPLYRKGRWLGAVAFAWDHPYGFDEQDWLIYTGLQQQVTPIMDSLHLLEQSQKRTMELARISEEIDTLYTTAQRLTQAITAEEQLEAVSDYARWEGATQGLLFYIDQPDQPPLAGATVAAEWVTDERQRVGVGEQFMTLQIPFVRDMLTLPARPTLIEDFYTHPEIDSDFLAIVARYNLRSAAVLPISSGGRWIGCIWFSWNRIHKFTPEDMRIYTAVLHQSAGVIDSLRLLHQTQRRAQELEIANAEIDLLYRTSEAINSANTYLEVIEAIAPFDPEADLVTLMLWENFDYHNATYIEPVAVIDRIGNSILQVNTRMPREGFPIGDTMWGERVWIFRDIETEPRMDPVSLANYRLLNTRAFMGPALYSNKRWIGGITFHSSRPREYSQREIRLFAGIGDLVLAAVERIRLQQEKEASRQRAELLAQINAALSQAVHDADILRAVVPYGDQLHVDGMLLLYIDTDEASGERVWRPITVYKDGEIVPFDARLHPGSLYLNREIIDLWMRAPDEVFFVEDISNDERISEESRQEFMGALLARAFAILPLVSGGHYYGDMRLVWNRPHSFSAEERSILNQLLQTLPAVVASRRNYVAERQRAHELEAVARFSAAAASVLDEEELLRVIAGLTSEQFSDYAILVHLLDDTHQILERVLPAGETRRITVKDSLYLVAQTVRTRESTILNDIRRASMYRFALANPRIQSIMALPMIAGETLIGVLEIQSVLINRFTHHNTRVMGTLADLVAVAIQNARLYQRAQAYAVLQERNRLARELHDSVSQAMYGIALGARTARQLLDRDPAKVAEPLDYVLNLSEAGLAEMRALIFELRPETLEKEGLLGALSQQVTMMQARYGIRMQTDFNTEPPIPVAMKEDLYWIVREALHNIVKHARATQVDIKLDTTPERLLLDVRDDGIGFNTDSDFSGHLGLKSMSERSQQIGATLTVSSRAGGGCHIHVEVPLGTS